MGMTTDSENEVTILARILDNEEGQLPVEVARYVLELTISDRDRARMNNLVVGNQIDELTPAEKEGMFAFGKASALLSILKSRAPRSGSEARRAARSRRILAQRVSKRAETRCIHAGRH